MTRASGNRSRVSCADHILAALRQEMTNRGEGLAWIERERLAVTVAANAWAEAHGLDRRITVDDVERIEIMAVGHVDYASKLSRYVADAITSGGIPTTPKGADNGV